MDSMQPVATAARTPLPAGDRTRRMTDALRRRAAAIPRFSDDAPAPIALAAAALVVFDRHLKHWPGDPGWIDRDRLVFAGAHAPALAQALLQSNGYEPPPGEPARIGRPRKVVACRLAQLGTADRAASPAHAAHGVTIVRARQSLPMAVGLALAEQRLAAAFGETEEAIIDHRSYALVDHECIAGPLAAHACRTAVERRLGKLVVVCHDDHATGIGEDPAAFFARSGWQLIGPLDADDVEAIDDALHAARRNRRQPTAVVVRSRSGFADSASADHAALAYPADHAALAYPADHGASQTAGSSAMPRISAVAPEARDDSCARADGGLAYRAWQGRYAAWQRRNPSLAAEFDRRMRADDPDAMRHATLALVTRYGRCETASTREATEAAMQCLGAHLPELLRVPGDPRCAAATANGVAMHGGFVPHVVHRAKLDPDTIESLRRAARQHRHVVHVFERDAADAAAQAMAGFDAWWPCDGAEAAVASSTALENRGRPSALFVSDQPRAPMRRSPEQLLSIRRGGYVLHDRDDPVAVLVASGEAVELAVEMQGRLDAFGIAVRVVSMPCASVFDRQEPAWRERVLPMQLPRWTIDSDSDIEEVVHQLVVTDEAARVA